MAADGRISARRRGYDSRWEKARSTFLAAHPHCARCAQAGLQVAAVLVDHKTPHRMGQARTAEEMTAARKLFWDPSNWEPMCVTHHSSAKQREERNGVVLGSAIDGRPLDPTHPWNRRSPA